MYQKSTPCTTYFRQLLTANTGHLVNVTAVAHHPIVPTTLPSALLVLYHVHAGRDGSLLLLTSDGRAELRAFLVQHLFPRLRRRTDLWEPQDEETDVTHASISQAFTYLHSVFLWLGHPPGSAWHLGTVSFLTLSYLLQDDPEITLWEHQDEGLRFVPWIRDSDFNCSLSDLSHSLGARWTPKEPLDFCR